MTDICGNCKWWNQERAVMVQNEFTNTNIILAYCEPMIPVAEDIWTQGQRMGLTAENYSCGKWRERDDG